MFKSPPASLPNYAKSKIEAWRVDYNLHRPHSALGQMIVALASVIFRIIYPLMPSAEWAMAMAVPALFLASAPYGVGAAAVQVMAPPRMRGQLTAMYYLIQTLIGLNLGPTLVAVFTEHVFEDLAMLRYSLLIVGTSASMAAALMFFVALAPYQATLAERTRT